MNLYGNIALSLTTLTMFVIFCCSHSFLYIGINPDLYIL